MSEPKVVRYKPSPEDDGVMMESDTGAYVSWRQYSYLVARVKELEKDRAALLVRVGELNSMNLRLAARVEELEQAREADDLAYIAVVEVMQAAKARVRELEASEAGMRGSRERAAAGVDDGAC